MNRFDPGRTKRYTDMRIEFNQTIGDCISAQIAFAGTKKFVKRFHRYGFPILTLCFFLVFLQINYPFKGKLIINGISYPYIGNMLDIILLLLFSLIFGWLTYILFKHAGRETIKKQISKLPAKAFGRTIVEINEDWIEIENPLGQRKCKWPLVGTIIETPKYIFITNITGYLLTAIPARTFEDDKTREEFVKKCNNLMKSNK